MNNYRYFLSVTSQFYFCGIPFRIDTTPKCDLNCSYCFAMSRGGRRTNQNLFASPEKLKNRLRKSLIESERNLDINGELLRIKMPVHFGGMSDPFANRKTSEISKRMIELFSEYDYPIVLSTKNTDELQNSDVIQRIMEYKNIVVQVSIPCLNERIAKVIEPNAPRISDRLKALKSLSQSGIFTIVRLQPLLPNLVKEVENELIDALKEVNVKHVIVEFLKLPVERVLSEFNEFEKGMDFNYYNYYKEHGAKLVGREWILPNELKFKLISPVVKKIHINKMTYGSADYGLNHMGDTNCCCGIDNINGFSNWFKPNFANMIRNINRDYIDIDSINNYWLPSKSIRMVINSHSRQQGNSSIKDFLIEKWNRPGTTNSPDHLFGIEWHGDRDSKGDCVYIKKKGSKFD